MGGERTAAWEFRTAWPTVAGAGLGMATGALTIFYFTQGLFLAPLHDAFGWTRRELSTVNLIGGVFIALGSVGVGWLVDRIGVRGPALVAYAVIAACFLGMATIGPNLGLFIALQLIVIAFGPANGPPAFTRAIHQSFAVARGKAVGAALGATGLMALVAPPAVAAVIHAWGWRAGYLSFALVTVLAAPAVLLLLSRGRRPDVAAGPVHVTPAGAWRNPAFLRLLIAFPMAAIGVGGLGLHLAPILMDDGYGMAWAATVQGLVGVSILLGRLATGVLMDRLFAPRVAAAIVAAAALGLFLLAGAGGAAGVPAAILAGLAMGAEGDVISYCSARYFGLPAYGRLNGLLYGTYTMGLGAGAFVLARVQEVTGSYVPGLVLCGGLMLGGAALLATAPPFPAAPREAA